MFSYWIEDFISIIINFFGTSHRFITKTKLSAFKNHLGGYNCMNGAAE